LPNQNDIDSGIKLAILTRQYSGDEFGVPESTCGDLEAGEIAAALVTAQSGESGHWYAKCAEGATEGSAADCNLMTSNGVGHGDPHYRTLNGCNWDDMSIGQFSVVQMKPDLYASFPLTIQFQVKPQQQTGRQGCAWCAQAITRTVYNHDRTLKTQAQFDTYLGYIAGAAIQFGTKVDTGEDFERAAMVSASGYSYYTNAGSWRSVDTDESGSWAGSLSNRAPGWSYGASGEYHRGPGRGGLNIHGCGSFSSTKSSSCYSEHFTPGSSVSTSGINIEMAKFNVKFEASGSSIKVHKLPRWLASQFGGMFGNSRKDGHPSGPTDYVAGWNRRTIKALNDGFGAGSAICNAAVGGTWGGSAAADCIDFQAGAPVPSIHLKCATGGVTGTASSDFNGNKFWKGQTKFMKSWMIDITADGSMLKKGTADYVKYESYAARGRIPSIFGTITEAMVAQGEETQRHAGSPVTFTPWEWAGPSVIDDPLPDPTNEAGEKTNAVASEHDVAEANSVCGDNINPAANPTNNGNCDFDQDALGGDTFRSNVNDITNTQKGQAITPTLKTVRDVSAIQYRGMSWVADATWGCVDDFALHLADAYKKWKKKQFHEASHGNQDFKDKFCKCQECWMGKSCAYDHFMCILPTPNGYGYVNKGQDHAQKCAKEEQSTTTIERLLR